MGLTGKTKYPEEVKAAFLLYADVLMVYADDQRAMIGRYKHQTKKEAADYKTRANVYTSIAAEMKEINWEKEDGSN